jgi:hypothetical protein
VDRDGRGRVFEGVDGELHSAALARVSAKGHVDGDLSMFGSWNQYQLPVRMDADSSQQ